MQYILRINVFELHELKLKHWPTLAVKKLLLEPRLPIESLDELVEKTNIMPFDDPKSKFNKKYTKTSGDIFDEFDEWQSQMETDFTLLNGVGFDIGKSNGKVNIHKI